MYIALTWYRMTSRQNLVWYTSTIFGAFINYLLTWTKFCSPTPSSGQLWTFYILSKYLAFFHVTMDGLPTDHLPTFSCPRSYWMPPYQITSNINRKVHWHPNLTTITYSKHACTTVYPNKNSYSCLVLQWISIRNLPNRSKSTSCDVKTAKFVFFSYTPFVWMKKLLNAWIISHKNMKLLWPS